MMMIRFLIRATFLVTYALGKAASVPYNLTAPLKTRGERRLRSTQERIEAGEAALLALRNKIFTLYGTDEKTMTRDVKWYDESKDSKLVNQMLRALLSEDKFVFAIGGMSDTAGHGNRHDESYPMVMEAALKPVFEACGVELVVRNMAMGGVPSFPDSLCMVDNYGADVDVLVWDFRMVEHDEIKGELFLRQSLMMPRAPSVMYKRENRYLDKLAKAGYAAPSGLHAMDETKLFNALHQKAGDALSGDKFCRTECRCPGQVRWHAGWKMQRLRGLQMAVFYGRALSKALDALKAMQGQVSPRTTAYDGALSLGAPPALPAFKTKALDSTFADHAFSCGLTWNPHVGRHLVDLVDTSEMAKGGTRWKLRDPNKRISESGKACGYLDDKAELEGTVDDGWVFFHLEGVSAGGSVGFCGDFPKDKRLTNFEVLVLLNGEEVQGEDTMKFWLDARTLGISIQCYGTSHMIREGANDLGFRVMEAGTTFKLTHVIWR